ncbi:MAG TPA: cell envelope integrity protein TolA [Candidatus Thioglobus sp.]|nr:cell envelope integrity protein TolA [Candidatus Thioglobus sp.]
MDQLKKFLNFIVNLFTGLIVAAVHPMVKIARKHPIAFVFAVVIHITLVVGLLYAKVESWEMPEQKAGAQQSVPTKAVTIDVEVIKAERQRLVDLEQKKQDKLESEIQQSEAAKKAQKHAEEHRKDEEKKAKEATKKKQVADEEREVTEAKAADASKRKELAEADALEAEKQKQLADEVRKETEAKAVEAELKAQEAEAKAKEAEEQEELAKQLTEEERKKKEQLEKERAAEAELFEKDQEKRSLTQEIQAEEDQERELVVEDQFSKLKSSYIGLIAARVKEEWRYMGAEDDWGCDVYIIQDEDGYVEAVNVQDCTIDDSDKAESFRNSIERAVYKASPLPMAPDQSVFDTEIMFFFRVN